MRFLFIYIACLLLSSTVVAQPPDKLKAKVILGIMGAQIDGDRLSGYNKPGLVAGMGMELKIGKKFSVQPEIMYCQKGSRSTDRSLYYMVVRLNYIDISGNFNFYVKPKLVLQGGISYCVLYKSRMDLGGGFVNSNDFFNPNDLCGLFSVEYRFLPKTAVNIRYGYSLRSVTPSSLNEWYNNTLSFTLRFYVGN